MEKYACWSMNEDLTSLHVLKYKWGLEKKNTCLGWSMNGDGQSTLTLEYEWVLEKCTHVEV